MLNKNPNNLNTTSRERERERERERNPRLSKRDTLRAQDKPSLLSFFLGHHKKRDKFSQPSPQPRLFAGGLKKTSRLSSDVIPDRKRSVPARESKNTKIPDQKRTASFLSGMTEKVQKLSKLILSQILLAFRENRLVTLVLIVSLGIGLAGKVLNGANAGDLNPPVGPVGPTMNSLQELGSFLIGDEDTSSVTPNIDGNVSEQLKYIATLLNFTYGDDEPEYVLTTADGAGTYDATNLTPENVANGVNFGVGQTGTLEEGFEYGDDDPEYVAGTADGAGTLLVNMKSGRNTANTFDVDNYNNGGAPATDRYETSWTKCNSGNSYCGTSDNRASAMDNVTGLIWSYPCSGKNCSNMTNETDATYNHATALTNCSNQSPWRLPWQQELMQAYINGAYGNNNLVPQGTSRNYWSATTDSSSTGTAWNVSLSHGFTDSNSKTLSRYVRCVRSAI